jgi:CubicO group peptidase (beta-lactamase class C family)
MFPRMKFAQLSLILTVITFQLCSQPARADRVDDYLKGEMDRHQIPGLALMVIQDGKTTRTSTYGLANIELNVPVTAETVFEIGSITKQFTAAGILLLVQDGKLGLDDPIRLHLKSIPDAWTNITIRNLLTHTSGIKSYTHFPGFELRKHLTQKQFIETIGAYPPDFPPGDGWKYSNTGFNLLGYIIENVSGQNYWEYMAARIFRPLGMTNTTDRAPGRVIPHRASGYEQTNHILINRDYDLTDIFSAGAIVTTLGDLTRWNAALDGDRLLSATTKAQMWTPAKLNNGKLTNYGFGWYVDSLEGHKNIGHSGATSGFSASLQRFPDDRLTVIILTNTDEQIATTLAKKVATFLFQTHAAR